MKEDSGTSLDALYDLLKEKRVMKVEDIAKYFNVNKSLVIEWGKILEAGNLATIEKPSIGKPILRLAGYTGKPPKKTVEVKKEKIKKEEVKKIEKKEEDKDKINRLIKKRNEDKIKKAEKIIKETRKRGYDNKFIKKMFMDEKWPPKLIDDLLKKNK